MSTIQVKSGDLEGALKTLKWKSADDVDRFKNRQAFTPATEERRRRQRFIELSKKRKEKKLLQIKEQYRREGKVFYDN